MSAAGTWGVALLVSAAVTGCASSAIHDANRDTAPRAPSDAEAALALVAELARPPLGTGVSITLSVRGRASTAVAGALYEGGPAVAPETPFNVASVSKLLTAAEVLTLAHEGRLALDASIGRYLPGVRVFDQHGTDRTEEITLRLLLSHRSGLPHQPAELDPSTFGSSFADPRLLTRLAARWQITLAGEPGTYRYSNMGYALLGALIETLGREPFADAMRPRLRALGMPTATFAPETLPREGARGHIASSDTPPHREPSWYASRYAAPFTGLWTTTKELVRFGEHLGAAAADVRAPLHEMARLDREPGHGLATVLRRRHGHALLMHDGGTPGFLSVVVVIPSRELVLALTCNADGEHRPSAQRFAEIVDLLLDTWLLGDATQSIRAALGRLDRHEHVLQLVQSDVDVGDVRVAVGIDDDPVGDRVTGPAVERPVRPTLTVPSRVLEGPLRFVVPGEVQ